MATINANTAALSLTELPAVISDDYKDIVLSHSPVNYWPMGKASTGAPILYLRGRNTTASSEGPAMTSSGMTYPQTGRFYDPTSGLNYCNEFSGSATGIYSSNTYSSGSVFDFQGDFTMEAWVYLDSYAAWRTIFAWHDGAQSEGWRLLVGSSGQLHFSTDDGTTNGFFSGNNEVPTGEWCHIAAVNKNGTLKGYVNGIEVATDSSWSFTAPTNTYFRIGATDTSNWRWDGRMQEMAIYDVALYDGDFDLPWGTRYSYDDYTGEIDLGVGNGATVVTPLISSGDNPRTPHATARATEFNGTDEYLFFVHNGYRSSDSQGTIEAWISTTNTSQFQAIFGSSDTATNNYYISVYLTTTGVRIQKYDGVVATYIGDVTIDVHDGVVHHIVVTSNGTTYKMYVDGVEKTITDTSGTNNGDWFADIPNRDNVTIGSLNRSTNINFFDGVIDDVAVYSTALTDAEVAFHYQVGYAMKVESIVITENAADFINDPYERLIKSDSPVNYWKLNNPHNKGLQNGVLGLQFNGGDGSTTYTDEFGHTITRHGTVDQSTDQTKFGASVHHNANSSSGNALEISGSNTDTDFQLTGDFTLEMWVYVTSDTEFSFTGLFTKVDTSFRSDNTESAYEFGLSYSTDFKPLISSFNFTDGSRRDISTTTGFPVNEWHHLAFTRSGGTVRIFLDGDVVGTRSDYGSLVGANPDKRVLIGASTQNSTSERHSLRGYIDDLVFINGYCKYDSAFTVPTKSFAADAVLYDAVGSDNLTLTNLGGADTTLIQQELAESTTLALNGVDQYAAKTISNYRSGDSSGSIEAWVKPDTLHEGCIFSSSSSGTGVWRKIMVMLKATGEFAIQNYDDTTDSTVKTTATFTANEIYHVVVTSSGTAYKIYVNGVDQSLTVAQGNNDGNWFADIGSTDLVAIGKHVVNATDYTFFDGSIDHVAVYNDVLTAADVKEHYLAGLQITTVALAVTAQQANITDTYGSVIIDSAPIDYWKLDQKAIASLNDDFTSYDYDLWTWTYADSYTPSAGAGSRYISAGKLFLSSDNDGAQLHVIGIKSNHFLTGDFDVQVDLSDIAGAGLGTKYMLMIAQYSQEASYKESWVAGMFSGGTKLWGGSAINGQSSTDSRAPTSGTIRIKRVGSTITTEWNTGTGWTVVDTTASGPTSPAQIVLRAQTSADADSQIEANYDNFTVTSDGKFWDLHESTTGTNALINWGGALSTDSLIPYGNALPFGTAGTFLRRAVADYQNTDTQGSIEAWIQTTDSAGENIIWAISDEASTTWYAYLSINAGEVRWRIQNTSVNYVYETSGYDLGDGEPHHIVVAIGPTNTRRIYIDGVNTGTTGNGFWLNGNMSNTDNITIGALKYSSGDVTHFDGTIDEVAYYDVELTAAQVTEHYMAGAEVATVALTITGQQATINDSYGSIVTEDSPGSHWRFKDHLPTAPFADDANTLLLVKSNTTDGNTTITDDAGTTISNNGVTHETEQLKFGSSSLYFNGTTDYFDSDDIGQVGTIDATLEAWIYPTSNAGSPRIFSRWTADGSNLRWDMYFSNSLGRLNWVQWDNPPSQNSAYATFTALALNTWHHIAVTRRDSDGLIEFYINGVKQTTLGTYPDNPYGDYDHVRIGAQNDGPSTASDYFQGYMDDVRISNVRRYVDSFDITDYAGSNDLTEVGTTTQVSSLVSGGDIAANFGTGGDYLSITNTSIDTLLTSLFTIECWFSVEGSRVDPAPLVSKRTTNNPQFFVQIATNGDVSGYIRDTNGVIVTATYFNAISDDTTYHFAVVVDIPNDTTYAYLNGVKSSPTSLSTLTANLSSTAQLDFMKGNAVVTASTSKELPGTLDEVAIYDYALTDDQVLEHYMAGVEVATDALTITTYSASLRNDAYGRLIEELGPLEWWRLDDPASVPTTDSFTGNDGDSPSLQTWMPFRSYSADSASGTIQSNKFETVLTNTNGTSSGAYLPAGFAFTGDFDVEVELTLSDTGSGTATHARLYVYDSVDLTKYAYVGITETHTDSKEFWWDDTVNSTGVVARSNDTGLKVRFTRSGTTLEFFTDDNAGSWTSRRTWTVGSNPLIPYLFSATSVGDTITTTATYDNFTVNSGSGSRVWALEEIAQHWGRIRNAATPTSTNLVADGAGSFSFNAADTESIRILDSATISSSSFTITGWFIKDDTSSDELITKGDNSQYSWGLSSAGNLWLQQWQSGGTLVRGFGGGTLTVGKKHFFAVYISSGRGTIYLDGVQVAENTTGTGWTADTSADMVIGARADGGGSGPYDGNIGDIAYFDGELSADEIKLLYLAGAETTTDALVITTQAATINTDTKYAAAILEQNPISYWKIDDRSWSNETFDGTEIDWEKWSEYLSGSVSASSRTVSGGALTLDVTANGTSGAIGLQNNFRLSGDFDITLDADNFTRDAGTGAIYFHIQTTLVGGTYYNIGMHNASGTNDVFRRDFNGTANNYAASDQQPFKVRITRVGTTLEVYTDDNVGSWTSRGTTTVSTADAVAYVLVYAFGSGTQASADTLSFNMTADTITHAIYRDYGTENTVLNANPQAAVTKIASLVSPFSANDALDFNGTDQYLRNGSVDYRPSDNIGTVTAWVEPDTTSMGCVWGAMERGAGERLLVFASGNTVRVYTYDFTLGDDYVDVTHNLGAGVPYHLAVTTTGSAWKIYINGQEEEITFTGGTNGGYWLSDLVSADLDTVFIGAWQGNSTIQGYFNGTIDHVAYFNRQLTDAEIEAQFIAGQPDSYVVTNTETLSITTYAANVSGNTVVDATTDALVITEQQASIDKPAVGTTVNCTSDALVITERQATVENVAHNIDANIDALVITEQQAGIQHDAIYVNTNVDALVITEQLAGIQHDAIYVNTNVDALVITEQQAGAQYDPVIGTNVDALIITGQNARVADSYVDAVLQDTPISFLRFESSSGEVYTDYSGNGNTGTANVPLTRIPSLVPNAREDRATVISTTQKITGTTGLIDQFPFTVEYWFTYIATASNAQHWCTTDKSGSYSGVAVGASNDGNFYVRFGNNTFQATDDRRDYVTNTTPLIDGAVHHIAMVFTGHATGTIYVNGVAHSLVYLSGTSITTAFDSNEPFVIGSSTQVYLNAGGDYFDEFAIYDKALTEEEIQAHYNAAEAPPGFIYSFLASPIVITEQQAEIVHTAISVDTNPDSLIITERQATIDYSAVFVNATRQQLWIYDTQVGNRATIDYETHTFYTSPDHIVLYEFNAGVNSDAPIVYATKVSLILTEYAAGVFLPIVGINTVLDTLQIAVNKASIQWDAIYVQQGAPVAFILTEYASTVSTGTNATSVALTITEQQAGIDLDANEIPINTNIDALIITEQQVFVEKDTVVSAASDSLTFTSAGDITIGFAVTLEANVDSLTITGLTLDYPVTIEGTTPPSLTITEQLADPNLPVTVEVGPYQILARGQAANVDVALIVETNLDPLIITGQSSGVYFSPAINVNTNIDALVITEQQIDIGFSRVINSSLFPLNITEHATSFALFVEGAETIVLTTYTADPKVEILIEPSAEKAINITTQKANVAHDITIEAAFAGNISIGQWSVVVTLPVFQIDTLPDPLSLGVYSTVITLADTIFDCVEDTLVITTQPADVSLRLNVDTNPDYLNIFEKTASIDMPITTVTTNAPDALVITEQQSTVTAVFTFLINTIPARHMNLLEYQSTVTWDIIKVNSENVLLQAVSYPASIDMPSIDIEAGFDTIVLNSSVQPIDYQPTFVIEPIEFTQTNYNIGFEWSADPATILTIDEYTYDTTYNKIAFKINLPAGPVGYKIVMAGSTEYELIK